MGLFRRHYIIPRIWVNGLCFSRVVIDPHYEEKHRKSVDDHKIIELVMFLDERTFDPIEKRAGFQYFVYDNIQLNEKLYKLVWLVEFEKKYIGVVNAYRR